MPDLTQARSVSPARPAVAIARQGGSAAVRLEPVRVRSELVRASTPSSFIGGFRADLQAIWDYRELLDQLVRKELKVKYKESVLGFFWSMARPMLQIVIYYVAFTIFLGSQQPAFAIFVFTGLLIWGFFTDVVGGCTGSVVGNGALIKKTSFPREILPLSVVGAALVNFVFQLVVLVIALAIAALAGFRVAPNVTLLLVPLALLVAVVYATAVGMVLSAATVYLRDLQYLVDVMLLAGFWLSPVVYPITYPVDNLVKRGHSGLLEIYLFNPMTNVIATFQRAFYTMGEQYTFHGALFPRLLVLLAVGLVALWASQRVFARLRGKFAVERRMSSAIVVHDVSTRFRINANKSLKEVLVNFRQTRDNLHEFWALRDISMEVEDGTTLGLIGHNGSGKSTLLKVIGGILTPTEGYVERRERLAALLELGAGFHGDLTGRENVFLNAAILGMSRTSTEKAFDEIVDFSGIEQFIDTPVKFYSSGMYVRLAFAVAVNIDPDLLLVDEVLAVGDEAFQRKCLDKIRSFQRDGKTIVFVTHGLDLARELCDRVVLLDHGRVEFDGDPVAAVRKIREDFEDLAESERREIPDAEIGNRQMLIESVRVVDADGRPAARFSPGESMGVRFTVRAPQRIDDWVAGIAIENQFDQLCYGSNTQLLGVDLAPVQGRSEVSFTIPSLHLAEGHYHVTVAVHGAQGPEYHRLNRVGGFKVFSDTVQDGPVHLVPQVSVGAAPGSVTRAG